MSGNRLFGSLLVCGAVAFGAAGVVPGAWLPAAAAQPAAGKKIDLRPRFKKGEEIRLRMKIENADTVQAPGAAKTEQRMKQEIGITLRVKETDPEKGSTLELVYDSLKLNVKTPEITEDFDSTKPASADSGPLAALLRGIVGTALTVEMDSKGNVKNVSSPDGGGAMGALAGGMMGADAMKSLFGKVFSVNDATGMAAVGESWTTESTMQAPGGNWKVTATQTLKSVSGGQAHIDIKGKVALDPASSGAGPRVKIQDADYRGKADWNTEVGMLDHMETTMNVKAEQAGEDAKKGKTTTVREAKVQVDRVK